METYKKYLLNESQSLKKGDKVEVLSTGMSDQNLIGQKGQIMKIEKGPKFTLYHVRLLGTAGKRLPKFHADEIEKI